MQKIILKANAKLNISLDILGKRADSYHEIETIMQSISLHDKIKITKTTDENIKISGSDEEIKWDETNLVHKAAAAFLHKIKRPIKGYAIDVIKNIPSQAGMGGGSADAAAVLMGMNIMHGNLLCEKELLDVGLSLGADVPFCIIGGTKLCRGVGEIMSEVNSLPECFIVIAKPTKGVSTKECFESYHKNKTSHRPNTKELIKAFEIKNLHEMAKNAINVFEEHAKIEEVQTAKQIMREQGAIFTLMTGSGSAVYGVYDCKDKATKSKNELLKILPYAEIATPKNAGVEVE